MLCAPLPASHRRRPLPSMLARGRCRPWFAQLGLLAAFVPITWAAKPKYVSGIGLDGLANEQRALDRTPSLYSGDFGDCWRGGSLLNVTGFEAALYYDNSTVPFHVDGTTSLRNESLMLYISVEAYGQVRFSMTVDPYIVNVHTWVCPWPGHPRRQYAGSHGRHHGHSLRPMKA